MGGQGKVERMRERERDSDSYFPPLARVTCARTIGACTVVRTPSARWQQLLSERMSFFFLLRLLMACCHSVPGGVWWQNFGGLNYACKLFEKFPNSNALFSASGRSVFGGTRGTGSRVLLNVSILWLIY